MKKNRLLKYGLLFVVLAAVLVFSGFMYLKTQYSPVAATDGEIINVVIPERAAASQIGKLLKDNQLIKSEMAFNIYLRQTGLATRLRPGHYSFSRSQSLQEIISDIAQGKTEVSLFTVPEGYTVEKIGNLLVSKGLIADYLLWEQALSREYDYAFLPAGNPGQKYLLEGYLFPDTYSAPIGTKPEDIINMMLQNFEQKWEKDFASIAGEKKMTLEEVIIIASMVEREAQIASDRGIIAGVIKNRLDRGMLLQICATVLYCLDEEKTELSYADLEIESPYNTYINSGLPPGPIACPGSASIYAALEPETHDYLYYVAKGDGSHYFSRTYQEHLEAIKIYQ